MSDLMDFEAELAALREGYVQALPGKISDLTRAVEAVRAAGGKGPAVGDVRLLSHRLRGAAGSYGLPAIGEAAGRIEDAIVAISRGAPLSSTLESIERALREIDSLSSAVGPGGGA